MSSSIQCHANDDSHDPRAATQGISRFMSQNRIRGLRELPHSHGLLPMDKTKGRAGPGIWPSEPGTGQLPALPFPVTLTSIIHGSPAMLKTPILHPQILAALGRAGHS